MVLTAQRGWVGSLIPFYVFFDCLGKSCNSATGKPASEVEKNLSRKKFSSISDELHCGDSSRVWVSLYGFHWLSSKNNIMVENRSGSLPEVLDVTALRELVTGNLEKLDRNSGRGKSMYHIFHLLMDSYFLASKKSEHNQAEGSFNNLPKVRLEPLLIITFCDGKL